MVSWAKCDITSYCDNAFIRHSTQMHFSVIVICLMGLQVLMSRQSQS